MAQNMRVQVNSLPDAPITQATSRPTSVLVQAPYRDTSGGLLGSLASALQDINPGLQQFMWNRETQNREEDTRRAHDAIAGLTFDQAQERIASGEMDRTESPFYQAAYKKQFGIVYAGERKQHLLDRYAQDIDKFNGDVDGFLAHAAQEDMDKYGNDKFVLAGIREGMGDFAGEVRAQHRDSIRKATQETAVSRFGDSLGVEYTQALKDGRDPIAAVRYLAEGQAKLLGITGPQIDDAFMTMAQGYAAQGNVDEARRILTTEITAADGTKLGAYSTRPAYATKAASILNAGAAKATETQRIALTGEIMGLKTMASQGALTREGQDRITALRQSDIISQSEYEGIIGVNQKALNEQADRAYGARVEAESASDAAAAMREGRGWAVQDRTYVDGSGNTKVIKAKDMTAKVVSDTYGTMLKQGKTVPEIAAVLSSFGSDVEVGDWSKLMNDGNMALTTATVKAGKDGSVQVPEQAAAGFELYRSLSPFKMLRDRHITPEAQAIYSDAEVLMQNGMDAGAALAEAASADRSAANPIPRISDKIVSDAVDDTDFSGTINRGQIGGTIQRLASIYMRDYHLPADKAVEAAKGNVAASTITINNVAVNRRNRYVGPDFEKAATTAVRAFAKAQGDDEGDLTLMPADDRGDRWIVVYADTGMPHEAAFSSIMTTTQLDSQWRTEHMRELEAQRQSDKLQPPAVNPAQQLRKQEMAKPRTTTGSKVQTPFAPKNRSKPAPATRIDPGLGIIQPKTPRR